MTIRQPGRLWVRLMKRHRVERAAMIPCQHAEGRTDVGYLQAMRQACAHVIIAAQGKNLCLILKAADSTGKQNAAVIPVIIAAVFLWRRRTPMPGSPARVRQKLLPIHHP